LPAASAFQATGSTPASDSATRSFSNADYLGGAACRLRAAAIVGMPAL
jgi:hypothetical protein